MSFNAVCVVDVRDLAVTGTSICLFMMTSTVLLWAGDLPQHLAEVTWTMEALLCGEIYCSFIFFNFADTCGFFDFLVDAKKSIMFLIPLIEYYIVLTYCPILGIKTHYTVWSQ